jgi:nitroreductase
MDFYKVIQTRRSVRKFLARAIDESILNSVLNAARIAPSGSNRQPWKFIVVTEQKTKEALAALSDDQDFIARAPVVIVACGHNIHYNRGSYMGDYSMLVDVAIAMDHLTLAARNEELGTCWIGSFDNEGIKKLLEMPRDTQVVALTPIGYPEDPSVFSPLSSRKKLQDIVSWERF